MKFKHENEWIKNENKTKENDHKNGGKRTRVN